MFVKTLKLHFIPNESDSIHLTHLVSQYRDACNFVSEYIFNHQFDLNQSSLNRALYQDIRTSFNLKSQSAQSVIKTVIARYFSC